MVFIALTLNIYLLVTKDLQVALTIKHNNSNCETDYFIQLKWHISRGVVQFEKFGRRGLVFVWYGKPCNPKCHINHLSIELDFDIFSLSSL